MLILLGVKGLRHFTLFWIITGSVLPHPNEKKLYGPKRFMAPSLPSAVNTWRSSAEETLPALSLSKTLNVSINCWAVTGFAFCFSAKKIARNSSNLTRRLPTTQVSKKNYWLSPLRLIIIQEICINWCFLWNRWLFRAWYLLQTKNFLTLLEPPKVAPNGRGCSRVVDHKRDKPKLGRDHG